MDYTYIYENINIFFHDEDAHTNICENLQVNLMQTEESSILIIDTPTL